MNILIICLIITLSIGSCIVFGFMSNYMFWLKGHNATLGFLLGFFFNFIAIIYAIGLPNMNPKEATILNKEKDAQNKESDEIVDEVDDD